MRITSNMISGTILRNISASYERVEKYEAQLASGKLFRLPSENPIAVNKSLDLRGVVRDIDQFMTNISNGQSLLSATDTALMRAVDILHRAKEITVGAANGTNSQREFDAYATEIEQILADMVNIGNTKHAGRYLFGGHKTTSLPFAEAFAVPNMPSTSVDYNGDSGAINYEIEQGITMPVNLPGNVVFKGSTDIFQVLIDVRDHLRSGDAAALSADIDLVDNAVDEITNSLAITGARANRLEATMDRLEGLKLNVSSLLSDVEDADFAEVVTNLKLEQNAYQAALITGSAVMQKSLMDFIR